MSTIPTWTQLPGSYDALHTSQIFPADNPYGIPALQHTPLAATPRWLVPYRTRIRSDRGLDDGAVHFFLDDYRFETVWARPYKALEALKPYRTLLTPDFSLYADWPLTLQLWNTYRNRWCGAFWQGQGFAVIPTITWSTPESYDFCFCGVPLHSLVAISTMGLYRSTPLVQQLFQDGFAEMVRRLQPSRVLCYGQAPDQALRSQAEVVAYPPRWDNIRAARRRGSH